MTKLLRVLSVEDQESDLELLLIALRRGGFELTVQRVETHAEMAVALNQNPWDVVLADHRLPSFDSFSALTLLQERGLDIPFIVVSGSLSDEMVVKSLKSGAQDFISKKNLSRLVPSIERNLEEVAIRKKLTKETTGRLKSEERFRKIFMNSNDAILVIDPEGDKILEINPRASHMLGFTKKELLSKRVSDIHPDMMKEFRTFTQAVLKKGRGWADQFTCLTQDNRHLPVEMSASVIHIQGRACILCLTRDISERKEAERRQRLSNTVFKNAAEAILVTDADEKILSINPAFTSVTGYSEADIIGQTPRILQSGKHGNQFYQEMWKAINTNGSWEGEIWDRKKSGEIYPKWVSIIAVKDKAGKVVQYTSLFSDITRRKEAEEALRVRAYYDPLTELPNRTLLIERLSLAIKQAKRNDKKVALLFIDLDRFKNVNDTFGHITGDVILKKTADRLLSCIRETDTVARPGGDEFLVILSDLAGKDEVVSVSKKVVESLAQPFEHEKRDVFLGASVGITMFPDDGEEVGLLLKQADMAMYKAKASGRSRYHFFNQEMGKSAKARSLLEWDLRRALDHQELVVYYQPIVDLDSLKTLSLEALVRWQPPDSELIPPDRFISIAEESGLISKIGAWVLETACHQVMKWRRRYGLQLSVSVNVSKQQFNHEGLLLSVVTHALQQSHLPPEALTLELTESLMLNPVKDVRAYFSSLKKLGVRLSIDDFGTGYSSLSYLWQYPFDFLKIDKSFVLNLSSETKKQSLVKAIVGMGQSMEITVIAEGVETYEDLSYLRSLGCGEAQGYYFSRPLSAEAYETVLKEQRKGS